MPTRPSVGSSRRVLVGRLAIDLAREQPLLVGRSQPAAAGIVRDDLVPATAQERRRPARRSRSTRRAPCYRHRTTQRSSTRNLLTAPKARELYSNVSAVFATGCSFSQVYTSDGRIDSAEGDMRSIPRLTLVALLAGAIVCGCESGSSEGPEPISFAPAPPPAGTGFVALYAPPVDVVPYPNDLYNPTGTRLAVPVKITSPLVAALNTLDGFSTTAVISAPFNAPLDPASLIPFNPLSMAPERRVDHRAQRDGRHAARAGTPLHRAALDGRGQRRERARDRAVCAHSRRAPGTCSSSPTGCAARPASQPTPISYSAPCATRTSRARRACRTHPR